MPVKPRETDFIGYMQSRRKNDKYLTDYLADIFIWISKTTIVHTIWSIIVFFKAMIRLVIWGQKYKSR